MSNLFIPEEVQTIENVFYESLANTLKWQKEEPENSAGFDVDISDNFGVLLEAPKYGYASYFGRTETFSTLEIEEHFQFSSSDLLKYVEHFELGIEPESRNYFSWEGRRNIASARTDKYLTDLVKLDLLKRRM